jgi:hypothetical protein
MRIIFLIIISSFLFKCKYLQKTENEVFVLHKNYIGLVIVVFNQKKGVKSYKKNNYRIYKIPKNGILFSQSTENTGISDFPKFYDGNIGSKTKIKFCQNAKLIPTNERVVFGGITGVANKDLEGKEVFDYVLYYVGNNSQIDSLYNISENIDFVKLLNTR